MPIQMSSITPVTHTSISALMTCYSSDVLSLSHPFFSLTVEQKGQLEKESGLQILEAGLSDVSQRK